MQKRDDSVVSVSRSEVLPPSSSSNCLVPSCSKHGIASYLYDRSTHELRTISSFHRTFDLTYPLRKQPLAQPLLLSLSSAQPDPLLLNHPIAISVLQPDQSQNNAFIHFCPPPRALSAPLLIPQPLKTDHTDKSSQNRYLSAPKMS